MYCGQINSGHDMFLRMEGTYVGLHSDQHEMYTWKIALAKITPYYVPTLQHLRTEQKLNPKPGKYPEN